MSALSSILGHPDANARSDIRCHECKQVPVTRPGNFCPVCEGKQVLRARRNALAYAWKRVPVWQQANSRFGPSLVATIKQRPEVIEAARAWARAIVAEDPKVPKTVTFTGLKGSGKTTLACATLREIISAGAKGGRALKVARGVQYAMVSDLMAAVVETPLGQYVREVDTAMRSTVMLLDEIGRKGRMPNDDSVFRIVHHRHANMKPTIFTTPRKSERDFAEVTGDGGFARRVFADALVIHLEGGEDDEP